MTKRERVIKKKKKIARALHVKAAPSSHIPARRKKGDLERLISLKLSSQPHSQPVCSHQPDTGLHQKRITQNIYRGIPTERDRAAGGLFLAHRDLQCANTQRWGRMNGRRKKKGWYRTGLQLATKHLVVSARGRCERRWETALYMKVGLFYLLFYL